MSLDASDFRHVEKVRRVRTPEGQKKYGEPIGTPITADMVRRAARGVKGAVRGAQARPARVVAASRAKARAFAGNPEYKKRLDKFEAAARAAKTPREKAEVLRLINQDLILKRPDRERLAGIVSGRINPDAPKKVVQAHTLGLERKAKKAAAAKKVAAKEPAGPGTRMSAAMKPAGLKRRNLSSLVPEDKGGKAPNPRKVAARKKIREAAAQTPQFDIRAHKTSRTQDWKNEIMHQVENEPDLGKRLRVISLMERQIQADSVLTPDQKQELHARLQLFRKPKVRTPGGGIEPKIRTKNGPETKAYEDIAAATNGKELDRINAFVHNEMVYGNMDPLRAKGVLNEIERKRKELNGGKTDFGELPATPKTTPHGPKTRAWKRLVQRDIRNAKAGDLIRLHNQIVSLHSKGRISQRERDGLLDQLDLKKNDLLGIQHKDPTGEATKMLRAIRAAKDEHELNLLVDRVIQQGPEGMGTAAFEQMLDRAEERVNELAAASRNKRKPTVVPKMPPGAGHQRALENMPDEWKQKIRAAGNDVDAIDRLMSDLERDKSLPKDQFNAVADALNAAMEQLPEPFPGHDAQHAHFATAKGTIANAPAEGLLSYMKLHPERFSIKAQYANKGVSDIDIITDQKTGERWFAKYSVFKNDYGKEVLAGHILNALGLSKHKVKVSTGDTAHSHHPVLITQDALQGNKYKGELVRAGDVAEDVIAKAEVRKGLEAGDPQGLIDMALFDYLIDNTQDRHAMNAFFGRNGGVMKVQFIDHGLAFGGMEGRPGNVSWREWFQSRYRANNRGGWNIAGLIGRSTAGRDDVARRIAKSAANMKKTLDLAKIRGQFEDSAAGNQQMLADLDAYMSMLEMRLEHILDTDRHDGMVRELAKAGGF